VEPAQAKFLNSWKEIAKYLNRGVRTVQRWEKVGLPVRRMHPGPRAPVIAAVDDLERWIRSAQRHGFRNPQNSDQLFVRGVLLQSLQEARTLRAEHASLRQEGRAALERLIGSIVALEKKCGPNGISDAIYSSTPSPSALPVGSEAVLPFHKSA
jgi:hypothetical protein